MKWGFRRPSFRKRLSARTSWKRVVRHSFGLKAPRGWGWLTNPRRAAYNRVYNRSTFGVEDVVGHRRRGGVGLGGWVLCGLIVYLLVRGCS